MDNLTCHARHNAMAPTLDGAKIAAPERAYYAQPGTAIQRTHGKQVKARLSPAKHEEQIMCYTIYRRVHGRSGQREFLVATFGNLESARDWLTKQATERRGNGLAIHFPRSAKVLEPTPAQQ